jgi:murein DD-endopeptidase MepM/ murein hydrolase activator NlpD
MADETAKDSALNRPPAQPQDEIIERVARSAAAQRARVLSDKNIIVPRPEKNAVTGNYLYETAPVPLGRLFGSPLAPVGPYAVNGIRRVSSGWGDARSTAYNEKANSVAKHQALDYIAPYGEELYATGDGTIRFVGFQSKTGAAGVDGISTDNSKMEIYNKTGEVVASKALNNIGFGGVCVWVDHSGDFQGYRSEYYHMSAVTVRNGQKVKEGDLIGNVGGTGGYYNWFFKGYHLHLQIAYIAGGLRALVRPTAIIPNYWPGHQDSTNSNNATMIIMPAAGTMGLQAATGRAANMLSALNRSDTLQNKSQVDFKNDQSVASGKMAQTMDAQQSAVHAASMGFQGKAPIVEAPLTFDFSNGVWSVGGAVRGPL